MRDVIFSYFIENAIYDMVDLDIQLEEYGIPCIIAQETYMTDQERLAAFEKMLQNVKYRYADSAIKMEKLNAEGKEKSVTYKQLITDKLTMQKILYMYESYGIEQVAQKKYINVNYR